MNLREFFLSEPVFIDVRAPVEFAQGALPGALNRPLLNDHERAEIGLIYKQQGQAAAVRRGHELISGPVKEQRLHDWAHVFHHHPGAWVSCFRGGLRSQISAQWMKEAGYAARVFPGGFKAGRRFLFEILQRDPEALPWLVVAGPTGAGKTDLLRQESLAFLSLDLEKRAAHRGSAFGAEERPQPSQVDFENQLAVDLLSLQKKMETEPRSCRWLLIEDESRMIGQRVQPESLFQAARRAPWIQIEEPRAERARRILESYVQEPLASVKDDRGLVRVFESLCLGVQRLQKKLGGLETKRIVDLIQRECRLVQAGAKSLEGNLEWIEALLGLYYDPFYQRGLERRETPCLWKGCLREASLFLASDEAKKGSARHST